MGERKGTKGLELWCRRMTDGYPGVNVVNMTTSWRDGLAFCAIIHHFRPDLIEFSKLNKDDVYYNNDLAFRTAERHLGIPALLEPEDMVEFPVPDRLSILTYLSQFYQTFAVTQGKSPSRIAPKRPATSPDHGIVSPASTSPPTKVSSPVVGKIRREPCAKCAHPVFLAERLNVGKLLYHRTCFKCARCSSQLTLANYYETEGGEFCCETCPDEEKPPDDDVDGDGNKSSVLSRSLSDEEKSASLKKDAMTLDDDYSTKFETALEFPEDGSLKRNATLTPFSQARSFFMSTQINDNNINKTSNIICKDEPPEDEEETAPDLPTSAPPFNRFKQEVEEITQPEVELSIKDTSVNSSLVLRSSSLDASSELEESLVVTKDTKSDVSLVKARMRLFETGKSVDDNVLTNEVTTDEEKVPSKDFGNSDEDVGEKNDFPNQDSIITVSEESVIEISDDSKIIQEEVVETTPPEPDEEINKPEIDNSNRQEEILEEDYPDDLNPFDEETEENTSLNPFGDDDDDDVKSEEKAPKPLARKKVKPQGSVDLKSSLYMKRISMNPFEDDEDEDRKERPLPATRKKVEAPRISLNPFWSEGEEEEERGKGLPVPKPRISKTSTPEAKPRESGLSIHSSTTFGSSTSLSSSQSGLAGNSTMRKNKKKAPKPPIIGGHDLSLNESGHSSLTSSPSQSVTHSPRATPKIRKTKKAPLPPTSTPLNPKSQLALLDDYDKEKFAKDETNMTIRQNNQLLSPSSSENSSSLNAAPDKSTYGKWKRRKGQAPTRPIPQKRSIQSLPMIEVKRELELIEVQQQGLERQGVRLEQIIRDRCEGPNENHEESLPPEVEDLVLQLFELVNEKNELFRKQAELMYLRRQHRLEEEHADVEYQIRCLMLQPEANKTDSDKAKEEELINRLVEIVERRNEIIECLEMDRVREAEEDDSINNQLNLYTAKKEAEYDKSSESKVHKKDKNKKHKNKLKLKFKGSHSKLDADKDIDESESSTSSSTAKVKEKKKKKFHIF